MKQQTIVKEKILEELKSRTSDSIPLSELTTVLRFSDEIIEKEIIEMILDGTIHFRISLDERRLIRYEAKEEEKCMICETSKDLTLQCTHCNAKVCIKCSESLRLVNGYFCIECSGELQNTNDWKVESEPLFTQTSVSDISQINVRVSNYKAEKNGNRTIGCFNEKDYWQI